MSPGCIHKTERRTSTPIRTIDDRVVPQITVKGSSFRPKPHINLQQYQDAVQLEVNSVGSKAMGHHQT